MLSLRRPDPLHLPVHSDRLPTLVALAARPRVRLFFVAGPARKNIVRPKIHPAKACRHDVVDSSVASRQPHFAVVTELFLALGEVSTPVPVCHLERRLLSFRDVLSSTEEAPDKQFDIAADLFFAYLHKTACVNSSITVCETVESRCGSMKILFSAVGGNRVDHILRNRVTRKVLGVSFRSIRWQYLHPVSIPILYDPSLHKLTNRIPVKCDHPKPEVGKEHVPHPRNDIVFFVALWL